MTAISRRAALTAAMLGAVACAPGKRATTAYKSPSGAAEGVFAHGVASGDPGADSVVLWTRVTPPADAAPVAVRWEIAADEAFSNIAASGEATTGPDRDWTVKAVPSGLSAGKDWHYRFRAGEAVSPAGRTRTLPAASIDSARFAVVSCSNFPFGYFNVYDLIARADDIDAVLHLGDYVYEYGADGYGGEVGRRLGRDHAPPHEALTLADYRARHAQYKSDPCSQKMLARHPLIAIWDDHETANDSWRGGAENHQPDLEGDWEARKRAAMQAYYEWMPIREPADAPREAIFRAFSYGDLLTLVALETRLMARDKTFEYDAIVPMLTDAEAVRKFREETLWSPEREMMGKAQLEFVAGALKASVQAGQPWRLLANQVTMASVTAPDLSSHVTEEDLVALEKQWDQARAFVKFSTLGLPSNLDAWDGYPAARERLYKAARDAGSEGLLVVTGDTHTWWANDLVARDGARMGVELGGHSVTSPSPYNKDFLGGKGAEYALLTNRENKSVRYLNGEDHGYIDLVVGRAEATARFMAVDTIEAPDYNAFEKARFVIRRKSGAPAFADVGGLTLKERALFG